MLPAAAGDLLLVSCDLRISLEGEADLVETFEQARATEIVDLKCGSKAFVVADSFLHQ